jgi:hypothetical protein
LKEEKEAPELNLRRSINGRKSRTARPRSDVKSIEQAVMLLLLNELVVMVVAVAVAIPVIGVGDEG